MTAKQVLIAARKLIEKEENWTQHTYARRINQSSFDYSPTNMCFCAHGAIGAAEGSPTFVPEEGPGSAVEALDSACGPRGAVFFNDTHTHREVLARFDAAISRCEVVCA